MPLGRRELLRPTLVLEFPDDIVVVPEGGEVAPDAVQGEQISMHRDQDVDRVPVRTRITGFVNEYELLGLRHRSESSTPQ